MDIQIHRVNPLIIRINAENPADYVILTDLSESAKALPASVFKSLKLAQFPQGLRERIKVILKDFGVSKEAGEAGIVLTSNWVSCERRLMVNMIELQF